MKIIPNDAIELRYTGQNDNQVVASPTIGTTGFLSKSQFNTKGKRKHTIMAVHIIIVLSILFLIALILRYIYNL